MSSLAVYGLRQGEINETTPPQAGRRHPYGLSKLEAEQALTALAGESFPLAIVRPPLVYGPGCRGNFPRLAALVRRLPLFPYLPNRRSMIYIDNLCQLLKLIVERQAAGIFYPQNREYVSTADLALEIARAQGRRLRLCGLLNPPLRLLRSWLPLAQTVFGDLYYTQSLSRNNGLPPYEAAGFAESVRRSLMEIGLAEGAAFRLRSGSGGSGGN